MTRVLPAGEFGLNLMLILCEGRGVAEFGNWNWGFGIWIWNLGFRNQDQLLLVSCQRC